VQSAKNSQANIGCKEASIAFLQTIIFVEKQHNIIRETPEQ
jgi:hypothetical protein